MRSDLVTVGILGGALYFLVDKLKTATPAPTPTYFEEPEYRKNDPFGVKGAEDLKDLLDCMWDTRTCGKKYGPRGDFSPPVTAWEDVVWHANIGGISGGVGTRQNVFGFELPTMATGQAEQLYTGATFTTKEKIGTGGRF
jgi:hypothetical protein